MRRWVEASGIEGRVGEEGSPTPCAARVNKSEELASRRRESVVVENRRIVDRRSQRFYKLVDDLDLARGAPFAGQAAEERFHQVVNETGQHTRCLSRIEVADFLAPSFAADLLEHRLETACDELLVETGWATTSHDESVAGRRPARVLPLAATNVTLPLGLHLMCSDCTTRYEGDPGAQTNAWRLASNRKWASMAISQGS